MPTVRDMLNANMVVLNLAKNPNLFVTTSFKFLPIMSFLTEVVESYSKAKETIVGSEDSPESRSQQLEAYLNAEVVIPDVSIGINALRNCGLTMLDIQQLHWWLVEFEDEYEDTDELS